MSNSSQARQRVFSLLDENSFVEIGARVKARATDFNLKQQETPSDGVITGYGVINGQLVYVFSQDAAVLNGSVGEMHAKKICNLYDLAMKTGAPVIGLMDSAGIRLQESSDALNAFGAIYAKQALASGIVPQITAVLGNCGGGLAIIPSLADFTFMEEKNAKLFVNSPNALEANYVEKNNTAGAKFQSSESGIVDVVSSESEIFDKIRALVSMIPENNEDDMSFEECTDELNRLNTGIQDLQKDKALLLKEISDNNLFFELKPTYAKEMVTGFVKLNGTTVGCVANRSAVLNDALKETEKFATVLTVDGCEKASKFINFCDAFSIPLLTITDVTGYEATVESEKHISKAVAKLTYSFASATTPKVNLITGSAFGNAYVAMNSKAIGADLTIAWENAKIGMMDAKMAAKIMYDGADAKEVEAQAAVYDALQNSVDAAASRGYVDQIISADETRKYVIGAVEMLFTKREVQPSKKHGTV